MADHLVQQRTPRDWTDERFFAFVLREAVPDELLARLDVLREDYMYLRNSPEATDALLQSRKQPMVELLNSIIDDALAAIGEMQRLSRLPDTIQYGLGGHEFLQITCRRRDGEQHADRLATVLDDDRP
ncbi:hypothetical protein [Amycolatopsis granulosa]|uniref:hypothetical protein n=1 Tax=Amycolatopsis granulosa TaxID=185684 RepID=UPI001FBBB0DA|nr:hypothetical protein [Amycolatopsis granulosa]NIH84702.1 hypothetical protein [Amycolatopsis granulosa]